MTQQRDQSPGQTAPTSNAQYHRVGAEDDSGDAAATDRLANIPLNSSEDSATQANGDLPQKQEIEARLTKQARRNVRRTYDRITADYWTYELIGMLFCVGTLVSIIAVLWAFHDSPTPHVMAGVTVSTSLNMASVPLD